MSGTCVSSSAAISNLLVILTDDSFTRTSSSSLRELRQSRVPRTGRFPKWLWKPRLCARACGGREKFPLVEPSFTSTQQSSLFQTWHTGLEHRITDETTLFGMHDRICPPVAMSSLQIGGWSVEAGVVGALLTAFQPCMRRSHRVCEDPFPTITKSI